MTDTSHYDRFASPNGSGLSRWERWTVDENREPIIEWDSEGHAEWCAKWAPPCPEGNPRKVRRALGFRERNLGELELRVPLGRDDGVCHVIVDDVGDEVYVRVLLCRDDEDEEPAPRAREYIDCPVRVWLDRPLGERAVIDVDSDEELPLYTPAYFDNVPQPDHGYRPANRRPRVTD